MLIFQIDEHASPSLKYQALLELTQRHQVSIFPVQNKKPLVTSWTRYQQEPPSTQQLRLWFQQLC